jgi:hypothetical protein
LADYSHLKIIDDETAEEVGSIDISTTSPSSVLIDFKNQTFLIREDDAVKYVNINIEKLISENCGIIKNYLATSPNLNEADRKICDNF